MSTSLAKQLGALSANELKKQKNTQSLLFDKGAGDIDIDSIHAIGCNGLMTLIEADPGFAAFQQTLFGEKIKHTDRTLLTKDDNDKLNSVINRFLELLTDHFLNPGSLKALEWLIRRFKINELNVNALLSCILPYHSTRQFADVVKMMYLKDNQLWSFLGFIRKTSVALERKNLVQRCITDEGLLRFICNMVSTRIKKVKLASSSMPSFFMATILDLIDTQTTFSENQLLIILPCLLTCLSTAESLKSSDFQAAAYMILAKLYDKVPLSTEVATSITDCIFSYAARDMTGPAVLCFLTLSETAQEFPLLSDVAVKKLMRNKDMLEFILSVLQKYEADEFTMVLFNSLFKRRDSQDVCDYLMKYVSAYYRTSRSIERSCSTVVNAITGMNKSSTGDLEFYKKLLVALHKRNGDVVAKVLADSIKAPSKKARTDSLLFEIVSTTLKGSRNELVYDAGLSTTLYVGLKHADANVRVISYTKLQKLLNEGSESNDTAEILDFARDALICGIRDPEEKVVSIVLGMDAFYSMLDNETACDELLHAISRSKLNENRITALTRLLKYYSEDKYKESFKLLEVVLQMLLPCKDMHAVVESLTLVYKSSKKLPGLEFGLERLITAVSNESLSAEQKLDTLCDVVTGNLMKKGDIQGTIAKLLAILTSPYLDARLIILLLLRKMIEKCDVETSVKVLNSLTKRLRSFKASPSANIGSTKSFTLKSVVEFLKGSGHPKRIELSLLLEVISASCRRVCMDNNQMDNWMKLTEKKSAVLDLFKVLASIDNIYICDEMAEVLISKSLNERALAFLCAISVSDGVSPTVISKSLKRVDQLLAVYLGKPANEIPDFQILLPMLMISLIHESKAARSDALNCVETILKCYDKAREANQKRNKNIFGVSDFYGDATEQVKFMNVSIARKLAVEILRTSEENLADADYLRRQLAKFLALTAKDQDVSENVFVFVLSNVLVNPQLSIQKRLMDVIGLAESPLKLKVMQPLFESQFHSDVSPVSASTIVMQLRQNLIGCFTATTIPLFFVAKSARYVKCFVSIIAYGTAAEVQLALSLVKNSWFNTIALEFQDILFASMVKAISTRAKEVSQIVRSTVMSLELSSEMILRAIHNCGAQATTQDERSNKRAKAEDEPETDYFSLTTILELLDSESVKIKDKNALIGPLFDLLGIVLNISSNASPVSIEYIRQLIVSAELSIFNAIKNTGKVPSEHDIRIELLVQCIRATDNPQTHNAALLLLSALSGTYPEKVLQSIVPIFTFMGANVLRRDDDYSFHVIRQTLETILPALISRHQVSSSNVVIEMIPVLNVFMDSLFHIPKHRRLKLFVIFTTTLGATDFLDTIIVMLLHKMCMSGKEVSDAKELLSFCLHISQHFEPVVQIKCSVQLLKLAKHIVHPSEEDVFIPIDLSAMSPKQIYKVSLACFEFIADLFSSGPFVKKFKTFGDGDMTLNASLHLVSELLESIVEFHGMNDADESPLVKGALKRLYRALTNLNALLPLPAFLKVTRTIMDHENLEIRTKAVSLLTDKISNMSSEERNTSSVLFKSSTQQLLTMLGNLRQSQSEVEATLHQSTLICINAMCPVFAKRDPELYFSIASLLVKESGLLSANRQIKTAALMCLSSLCKELGPRTIPLLPVVMRSVLDEFKGINDGAPVDAAFLNALGCINTVIQMLPQFVGPFLHETLDNLFRDEEPDGENAFLAKYIESKRDIMSNVASKVPPRVLIPTISGLLKTAMPRGPKPMLDLYEVASMMVANMEKAGLAKFNNELTEFFLGAFDYRRLYWDSISEKDIDKLDASAASSFIQLVMSLNESLFKPIFSRLVDWATLEIGGRLSPLDLFHRQIFFYRLLDALLAKLKSIFASFFVHVLDHAIQKISEYVKEKRIDALWAPIMSCMQKYFLYSPEGIITSERFEKILEPLAAQLDMHSQHGADYMDNMVKYVVPCLGQLAVNAGKESLWKPMNKAILNRTRSTEAQVRVASVKVLHELHVRLGEDFVPLVPETIPFLAELVEDNDEEVNQACNQLVAEMNKHLGEDINALLAQ